jgi:hypothetical protein
MEWPENHSMYRDPQGGSHVRRIRACEGGEFLMDSHAAVMGETA